MTRTTWPMSQKCRLSNFVLLSRNGLYYFFPKFPPYPSPSSTYNDPTPFCSTNKKMSKTINYTPFLLSTNTRQPKVTPFRLKPSTFFHLVKTRQRGVCVRVRVCRSFRCVYVCAVVTVGSVVVPTRVELVG